MKHSQPPALLIAIQRAAWAAFLLTLPITSFPYFPPAIGGEALVRPLALYPLILLLLLAVLPRLVWRPLPKAVIPLLPFVLVATVSSLLSLLRGIEPALGVSAGIRILRGMFTLGIGCSIYLTIGLLPETVDDLRFSLRWIYAGVSLALIWGTLQSIYVFRFDPAWFNLLDKLQGYLSIRHLFVDRISGFAYEPHWFADQIILLLLPWSLAAILAGYTVFPWRWRFLTVEWALTGWAILLLPFTYSRAGLLNLVVLTFFGVLLFRARQKTPSSLATAKSPMMRLWRPARRYVDLFSAILIVLIPIYFIGTKNSFFSRIWGYWQKPSVTLSDYLSYLGFDARVIYGTAALNAYQAYPILGVGLGNYAFYFEEMLPYRPIYEVPEVLRVITPEKGRDRLITSKNFYLRLLAETGIVGAIAFLAFIIAHVGSAIYLRLSPDAEQKYWGTACLCGLIAFGLSAFTFDSFVIPNMWVVFGLTTATTRVLK